MGDGLSLAEPSATDGLDVLRTRIRGIQQGEGRTWGQLAKQIGLGESTLSAFAAGKYAGDNARVGDAVAQWLATRETEARTRAALPSALGFIPTRTAEAFASVLEHAQYAPDMAVVIGGPGVGKTMASRNYATSHRNVWLMTAEPALATTRAVLEALCSVVGVSEPRASRRSSVLASKLTGSGGLVIVDEAQHMSTQAIDQLRSTVYDKAEIGLALVGNEELWGRIGAGERRDKLAQLRSRVGISAVRASPLGADVEALLDGAGVEGKAERGLLAAIARKPGALRGMMKTLRMAALLASGGDTPGAPSAQHIRTAWARLSDSAPLDPGAAS
jgi:DNA transposition AAA+ family ATPase